MSKKRKALPKPFPALDAAFFARRLAMVDLAGNGATCVAIAEMFDISVSRANFLVRRFSGPPSWQPQHRRALALLPEDRMISRGVWIGIDVAFDGEGWHIVP